MTDLTLPRDEYEAVRKMVAPFASRDTTRPILCQVHVRVRNRRREFTATDSYRLARYRSDEPAAKQPDLMVGRQQFRKAAPKKVATVTVEAETASPWPDCDSLICKARDRAPHPFTFNGDMLPLTTDAAATAVKEGRSDYGKVRLLHSGNRLLLEWHDDTDAGWQGVVQVEGDAPAMWCTVNATYLRDLVKAGATSLALPTDGLHALRATADRCEWLLMPVRED